MKRTALAVVPLSALALPSHALSAAEIEIEARGPVVELNVFETVPVAPDLATIGAGITSEAATATEALRQNSAQMQRVIAQIKAQGIAEKDIQTTGINLNAVYDYTGPNNRAVFRAYQASNRVSVILRSIDRVGGVLDALVVSGATDLNGPMFSVENDEAAKETARRKAIARADARVKEYAQLLGFDGAKVLSVTEAMEGYGGGPQAITVTASSRGGEALPPVQPGMIGSGVNITIKYELTKGGAEPAPD